MPILVPLPGNPEGASCSNGIEVAASRRPGGWTCADAGALTRRLPTIIRTVVLPFDMSARLFLNRRAELREDVELRCPARAGRARVLAIRRLNVPVELQRWTRYWVYITSI